MDSQEPTKPMNALEAAKYLSISLHTLHKWTSRGIVPFYKPNGRLIYFRRDELDTWVYRNHFMAINDLVEKHHSGTGPRS